MKPKTAAQFLRQLFETDPNSEEYWNLSYTEAGLNLGTKPWWPPFTEVWADEVNPHTPGTDHWHRWRDARALLERLHADYRSHNSKGTYK